MSDLTQIRAIRSQTVAQLVALRASPKPDYDVDGQHVKWESYARSLEQTIDWCDRKLADGEPYEIASLGCT